MVFFLREATPGELERLASALPTWRREPGDLCVVAEGSSPTRVVGGMVFGVRRHAPGSLFGLWDFTVSPRFRETDLLERLVRAALERAAALDISSVDLLSPVPPDAPEFAMLERLGFAERRRLICYEFDVPSILERSRATRDRLIRRGAIPGDAQAVPLSPRLWPDAARMVLSENLIEPGALKKIDEAGPTTFFNRASRVLVTGGEVKGVILGRDRGSQSEVMALAVAPEIRGGNGWANAVLNFEYASLVAALGQEIITMWAAPETHPMTTRLARRMASPAIATQIFLRTCNVTI